MKVQVTRGAGFVGGNLAHTLIEETDWHVHVFDKLTDAGQSSDAPGAFIRTNLVVTFELLAASRAYSATRYEA